MPCALNGGKTLLGGLHDQHAAQRTQPAPEKFFNGEQIFLGKGPRTRRPEKRTAVTGHCQIDPVAQLAQLPRPVGAV
ncbi:MAG: hypothetical protein EBZ69_02765 [Alphaproteobacteria bacterium]|nr:hypothetical protein [Alphaproteobacteria bacterium]NDG04273.1 hypothetical protein [Alphaproteobacteria bacterium]